MTSRALTASRRLLVVGFVIALCAAAIPVMTAHCQAQKNPPAQQLIASQTPRRAQRQRGLEVKQRDPIKQWPDKPKRYAVIIGVDQYEDAQITGLEGAGNDAKLLAESLRKYSGFPEENVVLLTSDQPASLQPKQRIILRYLRNLHGLVPKDGLLLVAFAGHGIQRGGRAYLLPSDAEANSGIAMLEETAIPVERVHQLIRETEVDQVVIILDACRNDPFAGRSNSDNLLTEAYTRGFNFDVRNQEVKAFVTLYATEVGQRAYEFTDKVTHKKHGYFTQALVDALRGANGKTANEKGEVTLGGVIKYVAETVPKQVQLELGPGNEQRPFPVVEGYANDLVIAFAQPSMAEATAIPRWTVDPALPDTIFWDSIRNSSNPEMFRAYLEKYPNGQFARLAAIKLQELAGSQAKTGPQTSAASPPRQPSQRTDPISRRDTEPKVDQADLAFWNSIANSSNPEMFKAYLEQFPRGQYANEARSRLADLTEVSYWNSIASSGDAERFKAYLDKYPNGKFVGQARAQLEELSELVLWKSISNSANPDLFNDYLRRYPNGKFARVAKAQLQELEETSYWESVESNQNPEALKRYLARYPNGKFASQAKARISELAELQLWTSVSNSGNADTLKKYLQEYPNGRFSETAKAKLDELSEQKQWDSIVNSSDPEAFRQYIEKHPNGKFVGQADARLKDLREINYWNSISNSTNPEAFQAYLDRNPNGRFANQARERMNELTEASYWNSISNDTNAATFKKYLETYPNGTFVKQARERFDALSEVAYWNSIANSESPEPFKTYLDRYPAGQFARLAQIKYEQLTESIFWKSIAGSSNPDELTAYLDRYPNGQYAKEASARVDELNEVKYWTSISSSNDPESFKAYLQKYPNGKFARIATIKLAELANKPAEAPVQPRAAIQPGGETANRNPVKADSPDSRPSTSESKDRPKEEGPAPKPPGAAAGAAEQPVAVTSKEPATAESVKRGTAASAALSVSLSEFEFDTVTVKLMTPPAIDRRDNSEGSFTVGKKVILGWLKETPAKGRARYFVEPAAGVPIEMVEVSGGRFLMGVSSAEAEKMRTEFERMVKPATALQFAKWQTPQHEVTVPTFYMGKFEVTQAQWRAVASLPKVNRDLNPDPSAIKGDDLPVNSVSWNDAMEFCARLSEKTGRTYRLPTEAEWEYACRAGSTTPFGFGEAISTRIANFDGNFPEDVAPKGAFRQKSVPVGSLGVANALGLFDMHGNLWEWCLDSWHESYEGAPSDGSAWTDSDNNLRALRGGSWINGEVSCRSTNRSRSAPASVATIVGFRVVMVTSQPAR